MGQTRGLAVGIDIGGTKVAAGVVDTRGRVLARTIQPTPTRSPAAVEDTIVMLVDQCAAEHDIVAVGIGAAGWIDSDQAVVRFSPHLAWRNEPLRDRLADRLDLPLVIDNDANAAAWAEYRFGAGEGSSVMLCLTMGTGIGGGLVIDGKLFRGSFGMAGEFAHMCVVPDGHWCPCGNRGCWEQYSSGNALQRDARDLVRSGSPRASALRDRCRGDADRLQGRDVTAVAMAGDPAALELLADAGRWLGRGIADLTAGLDPDLVVVGGGLGDAGELLLQPAREAFERHLTGRGFRPVARIESARLGSGAGLVGAADLARQAVLDPPDAAGGFWPRRWRPRPRRSLQQPGAG